MKKASENKPTILKDESKPATASKPEATWASLFSKEHIERQTQLEKQDKSANTQINEAKQQKAPKKKAEPKPTQNKPKDSKQPTQPPKRKKRQPLALADYVVSLDEPSKTPLAPFVEAIIHPDLPSTIKPPASLVKEYQALKKKNVSLVENPNTATSQRFVVRRGKEREKPKAKKFTKLKKVIYRII
jgi:hypothetical protein